MHDGRSSPTDARHTSPSMTTVLFHQRLGASGSSHDEARGEVAVGAVLVWEEPEAGGLADEDARGLAVEGCWFDGNHRFAVEEGLRGERLDDRLTLLAEHATHGVDEASSVARARGRVTDDGELEVVQARDV